MIKEITMPAGGQTTDTSVVGSWLVKPGDQVKRGDALLEIETDKATLTVESFAKGTVLALLVEEGEEASAGDVIAYIGDESDRPEVEARLKGGTGGAAQGQQADEAAQGPTMSETVQRQQAPGNEAEDEYQPIDRSQARRMAGASGRTAGAAGQAQGAGAREPLPSDIKAMPNAKKLAKEHQISLGDVAAFAGKSILKRQDVEAYLKGRSSQSADTAPEAADVRIPLTNMRKVIARRMTESAQTIPVFEATVEADMTACIAFRKAVNAGRQEGKISYNDILFKCMAAAIRKYPNINASYTDDAILVHREIHAGLAVSIPDGLVVPVVRDIQKKGIEEIARQNRENVKQAREGKLTPAQMSGGTITLSNLGMYPVTQFKAIINPPEACILAIGAMEEKPVLENGQWKAVTVMKITGSFDHRIIDGAYGAGFLAELKKIIENPALALM